MLDSILLPYLPPFLPSFLCIYVKLVYDIDFQMYIMIQYLYTLQVISILCLVTI